MPPRRVLHIMPDLDFGGVASFVLHHLSCLDAQRYAFDFVTHGERLPFHADLEARGCRIHYLQPEGRVGLRRYAARLMQLMREHPCDIAHIHLGHYTGLVAALLRLQGGCPPLVCHAHTTRCMNSKHRLLMPAFRLMARAFADARFACGHDAGAFCFGSASFTEVHNAVDMARFSPRPQAEVAALRSSLGIPAGARVIGHIGSFGKPKNHPYLLKIAQRYLAKNPTAVFVLVGDGPLRPQIEQQARQMGIDGNIRFAGTQSDTPLYYSLFDAFILPSLHEGLPVVSAEAQSMGLPCVFSANIDRQADMGAGLMTFVGITDADLDAWCQAIDAPAPTLSRQQLRAAFIEKHYEIQESCSRLMQLYDSIARPRKA